MARAEGLAERDEARLRKALARDDRRTLVDLCDAIGEPAHKWLRKHHAKLFRWVSTHGACRSIADFVESTGVPAWRGSRFVRLSTPRPGMATRPLPAAFRFTHGWLIDERPRSVVLLGPSLRAVEYSLRAEPGVVDVDFEQFCLDFLAAGDRPAAYDREYYRRGGVPPPGDSWVWCYYALRCGQDDLAVRLAEHANRNRQTPSNWFSTGTVARHLRYRAMAAAHAGVPRPELARLFRLAHPRATEVQMYASLALEDGEFVEPLPPDLLRADVATRARYWLYKLRDHAAFASGRLRNDDYEFLVRDGPARKLVELGWDAIPSVVERLDDPRPTRSLVGPGDGLGRYILVSHGRCCREILHALVARRFRDAAEARRWWRTARKQGAEAYYTGLLREDAGSSRAAAVHGLMRLDPGRHRGPLLRAAAGDEHVLAALAEHLTATDPVFDGWLADARPAIADAACRALWRKGDERGPRNVLERVRRVGPDDTRLPDVEALGRMHVGFVADGLGVLFGHANVLVRRGAFLAARHFPDPVLARRLVAMLDDREDCGGMDVRDCAAIALVAMLDYDRPLALPAAPGYHEALRRWCNANWQTFDWEWLRRNAR